MPFDASREQELADITAITHELNRRARECQGELDRIEAGQDKALGRYPPLVAFVHIPKTAGAAVATMFTTAYTRKAMCDTGNYISSPEKVRTKLTRRPGGWERWQRQGGRVAIGHTPYGSFRDHLPSDTRYITFLREPVDRVLSHYYRHVHLPGMSEAEQGNRGERASSLEQALVRMRLPQLRNLCTRFLCSHPTLEDLPSSAVEEAKENLRKFAFVGIQERFDESVVLLQRTLGLRVVPYLHRHVSGASARPSVDAISERERTLIEECNQLDIELYAFSRELFQQALADTDEAFGSDVERLRSVAHSARKEHAATVEAAREWLHHELPAGSTESMRSVVARAEAAGLTRAAITEARKELLVKKGKDEQGKRRFTRPSGASLTALRDAKEWLEQELPAGTSESRASLIERGKAAGHPTEALNTARKLLSVTKVKGPDGQWVWSREGASPAAQ